MFASLSEADKTSVSSVPLTFESTYEADSSKFWNSVQTAMITFAILIALSWAFASHNWARKAQSTTEALTLTVILKQDVFMIGSHFVDFDCISIYRNRIVRFVILYNICTIHWSQGTG